MAGSATDPDGNLPLTYRWSVTPGSGIVDSDAMAPGFVQFDRPGSYTVTFTVADAVGQTSVATRIVTVPSGLQISRTGWNVRFVDSEATGNGATLAFDNDPATFWHTEWQTAQPPPPHEIQIDLGASNAVTGFRYRPRQDGSSNGNIGQYHFYVSGDPSNWGTPVAAGSFVSSSSVKEVETVVKTGRYIKLLALTEANGLPYTSVAELEVLQKACIMPSIRLTRPAPRYIQASPNLALDADACLRAGEGVRFVVDGGMQLDDYTAPYSVTVSGLSNSEHRIEAQIIDAAGTPIGDVGAYDLAENVGIGESYVAIGDGITYGYGDDRPEDDNSEDGRTMLGGYTSILADALTAAKGYPVAVANAGVGGTASGDGAASIGSVLGAYPSAQRVLVMYGHNDAIRNVSSGLGLGPQHPGYAGSFKHNIQRIIDAVRAAGKAPILAKAPGVLPLNTGDDVKVQEYNQVIEELAADPANGIPVQPPDFRTHFETRTNEYANSGVEMNGLGYQSMAQVWLQHLAP
jgi:lysophospholipase L1-like esterase